MTNETGIRLVTRDEIDSLFSKRFEGAIRIFISGSSLTRTSRNHSDLKKHLAGGCDLYLVLIDSDPKLQLLEQTHRVTAQTDALETYRKSVNHSIKRFKTLSKHREGEGKCRVMLSAVVPTCSIVMAEYGDGRSAYLQVEFYLPERGRYDRPVFEISPEHHKDLYQMYRSQTEYLISNSMTVTSPDGQLTENEIAPLSPPQN